MDYTGQNTGVGSLSLLQGIFPTQESNWGLLHCRWILYQLSYWGSLWNRKQDPNSIFGLFLFHPVSGRWRGWICPFCAPSLSHLPPHTGFSHEMLLPQGLDTLGLSGFICNPFPGPLHSWRLSTVQASASSLFSFQFYVFIYYFCLHWAFVAGTRATPCCSEWDSHCSGFYFGAQALELGLRSCGTWGSVAPRHVKSPPTWGQTIGRW